MEYATGEDTDTLWSGLDQPQKAYLVVACAEILKALHSSDLITESPANLELWASGESSALQTVSGHFQAPN